ncbi:MAG TPA: serine/threonine protein kinase, partial [Nannocystis exedens]|nr:serine/threonine protein kinase [Nannocystis exedens]
MRNRDDSLLIRKATLGERYELLTDIGRGGFATVYRAHDLNMGIDVAVKVLKKKWCASEEFRRRFLQESKHHAILKHPRIVPVSDRGTTDDNRLYFVMDLLRGQSLDKILKENPGPMTWDQVVPIIVQICEGLDFAHRNQIVHRDIKPGNIFIESTGDGGRLSVKILDLGIAKELPNETSSGDPITALTDLNRGGAPCTPEYMSPEQAQHYPASAQTDIYALGVVMYLMLTGSLPFRPPAGLRGSARHSALSAMHLKDEVEPLRQRCPEAEIPPLIEGIVLQTLAKRPEERFHSARDLIDALLFAERRLDESSKRDAFSGHRRERRMIRLAAGFSSLTTAVSVFLLLLLLELPGLQTFADWIMRTPAGDSTTVAPSFEIQTVPDAAPTNAQPARNPNDPRDEAHPGADLSDGARTEQSRGRATTSPSRSPTKPTPRKKAKARPSPS